MGVHGAFIAALMYGVLSVNQLKDGVSWAVQHFSIVLYILIMLLLSINN